jgi:maltooligosyltrehalose trehalohydrolase
MASPEGREEHRSEEQLALGAALGAEVRAGAVRFRLFSTTASACSVRLFGEGGAALADHAMAALGHGVFSAQVAGAGAGTLYKFVLDGRELPDPYARFLPFGVHGPARVEEPRYRWRHGPGVARPLGAHVLYELHLGTFTEEGTYRAALTRLPSLATLGVTTLELMPLSSFPGARGWGYDGVAHFAPYAGYGTPDELRAFVDGAHGLGLSVLLDVVYNHFGPSGNYLGAYSPAYFTRDIPTAWGDAPDFAHEPLRRYVIDNALYWLEQFRFDGLRIDATHAIVDPSPRHVLRELADRVRALQPPRLLIAEDERNEPALVVEHGLDAIWADDFHHQLQVTLTGERDGYYAGYTPGTAGLAQAIRRGWLYEGQTYAPTGRSRGAPATALGAEQFVYCLQNHDQVGNRALGERLSHLVSADAYRAASTLLLFLPGTPLLFMGQEWAASSPFQYFTDHEADLGRLIAEGRRAEFKQFAAFSDPRRGVAIPDPQSADTFARCKLRWDERHHGEHRRVLELYRSLLALRASDPVLRDPSRDRLSAEAHGDVLAVRRWRDRDVRLLLVNFGAVPIARASLPGADLRVLLGSESDLAAHAAVILTS